MLKKPEDTLFNELGKHLLPIVTDRTASFNDSWRLSWNNKLGMQMVYWFIEKYAILNRPASPIKEITSSSTSSPSVPAVDKEIKTTPIPTMTGPVIDSAIVIVGSGGSVKWQNFSTPYCTYLEISISDIAELCFDSKLRGSFFKASIRTSIKTKTILQLSDISNSITYDKSGSILRAGCDSFPSAVVGLAVALLFDSEYINLDDAKKYYSVLLDRCILEGKDKSSTKTETSNILERYISSVIQ